MRDVFGRMVVAGIGALAAFIAYRAGGGADPRPVLPRAEVAERPSDPRATPETRADGYEVAVRLVEQMGEARVEVQPSASYAPLRAYNRKAAIPWVPLVGDAAKWTTNLALRTSESDVEEGSFDARHAIAFPTPATASFHVALPAGARLDVATAVLGGKGETELAVSVVDAYGHTKDVFTRTVPSRPGDRLRLWEDASVDLSPWSGQLVDVRLRAVPKLLVSMKGGMSSVEASGSAVALWGHPTILSKRPTALPYNVLWITVDGLRPDAIASFHDDDEDQRRAGAKGGGSWLPKQTGLTKTLDALASRGVRFTHAYTNGAWTRPATLAMLSGARSTELGIDPHAALVPPDEARAFYASRPPLLPLLLGRAGAETRAFVNDDEMLGYTESGIDTGFERVDERRDRTRDTVEISSQATEWLKHHADDRFFLFCHFKLQPPAGPKDDAPRAYMAEATRQDEAMGVLLGALDELHLRERTLVVVTADHAEALSKEHAGGIYEETARVPILLSLPGVLPEGREVKSRVRSLDIAPTVLDILRLEGVPASSGASLMPLVRGATEPDERVVLVEGRATRALFAGKWHLVAHEGTPGKGDTPPGATDELFDLEEDPAEHRNLAREKPNVLAEMHARLDAASHNVAVAGTQAAARPDPAPDAADGVTTRLRFAGAGAAHRIVGSLEIRGANARILSVAPVGAPSEAVRLQGTKIDVAMTTSPDALVGLDVRTFPPNAALAWELFVDDAPLSATQVFGGPFGFVAPALKNGITTDAARTTAYSPVVPQIELARDFGLFVTRDRPPESSSAPERAAMPERAEARLRRGRAGPGAAK